MAHSSANRIIDDVLIRGCEMLNRFYESALKTIVPEVTADSQSFVVSDCEDRKNPLHGFRE